MKPALGSPARNAAPYEGERALMIDGYEATSISPRAPMVRNQTAITGPNSTPTAVVPNRCSANSPISTASDSGTTCAARAGDATLRPDTAETTEMAGVSMPSP